MMALPLHVVKLQAHGHLSNGYYSDCAVNGDSMGDGGRPLSQPERFAKPSATAASSPERGAKAAALNLCPLGSPFRAMASK